MNRRALCLLAVMALPAPAAAFDELADEHSPRNFSLRSGDLTLTLKGEVELELHDLEGRGGPGHDSVTDTRTIGTRSPFAEIDSLWLGLRLELGGGLMMSSVLDFDPRGARVGDVWLDLRRRGPDWLEHHGELGFHTPFVSTDRRSERYPLIATIYWRESELHLSYEARVTWAPLRLVAGISAGFMRPLAFAGVQESEAQRGTINVLAYGSASVFSGLAPVLGAKAGVEAWGVSLTGFGYRGRLAVEQGTAVLHNVGNFQDLPGAGSRPDAEIDRTFWWAGGRLGYDGYGAHVIVEAITSRESLLRRDGGYAQLSYELPLWSGDLLHALEPLVRHELYRLRGGARLRASGRALRSPAPSAATTWDWRILTVALIARVYRDLLTMRFEYYWIDERNGVPALGIDDEPIRNDELLAQLELRF